MKRRFIEIDSREIILRISELASHFRFIMITFDIQISLIFNFLSQNLWQGFDLIPYFNCWGQLKISSTSSSQPLSWLWRKGNGSNCVCVLFCNLPPPLSHYTLNNICLSLGPQPTLFFTSTSKWGGESIQKGLIPISIGARSKLWPGAHKVHKLALWNPRLSSISCGKMPELVENAQNLVSLVMVQIISFSAIPSCSTVRIFMAFICKSEC